MTERAKRKKVPGTILFLSLGVLLADQATKAAALHLLSGIPTLPVLPGIFHLTLTQNSGVAFGLFRRYGLAVTVGTLLIIAGLLGSLLRQKGSRPDDLSVGLGMVLGGAIGNLIDRFFRAGVVDFLDFRVWPVFNVADSFITVGAAWMGWRLLKRPRG